MGVKTGAGVKYMQLTEEQATKLIAHLEYDFGVVEMLSPGSVDIDSLPELMKGLDGFLAGQGVDLVFKNQGRKAIELVHRVPDKGAGVAPVTDFKKWLRDYKILKPEFLASIKKGDRVAPDNA